MDSSAYVDEAVSLLAFMEDVVWPALGIPEPLALALSAWVHFRCGGVLGEIYRPVRALSRLATVAH